MSEIIVIDSSAMLATLLPDENVTDFAQEMIERIEKTETQIIAPALLEIEVANGLKAAVLQKRLTQEHAQKIFDTFSQIPFHRENVDMEKTMVLAFDYQLSIYDAAYLQVALAQGAKLYTLDKKLLVAYQKATLKMT